MITIYKEVVQPKAAAGQIGKDEFKEMIENKYVHRRERKSSEIGIRKSSETGIGKSGIIKKIQEIVHVKYAVIALEIYIN